MLTPETFKFMKRSGIKTQYIRIVDLAWRPATRLRRAAPGTGAFLLLLSVIDRSTTARRDIAAGRRLVARRARIVGHFVVSVA